MNSQDLLYAAVTAVVFTGGWIGLSFLLSSEPAYANAIAGGIAWFAGVLVFRNQMRERSGV